MSTAQDGGTSRALYSGATVVTWNAHAEGVCKSMHSRCATGPMRVQHVPVKEICSFWISLRNPAQHEGNYRSSGCWGSECKTIEFNQGNGAVPCYKFTLHRMAFAKDINTWNI